VWALCESQLILPVRHVNRPLMGICFSNEFHLIDLGKYKNVFSRHLISLILEVSESCF
jgi:hypothetical protein